MTRITRVRPILRATLLLVTLGMLPACGSDDDGDGGDGNPGVTGGGDTTGIGGGGDFTGIGDTGTLTFVDFRDQVIATAGADAEECPDLPIEKNACLAQAFANGTAARFISTTDDFVTDPSFGAAVVVRDGDVTFHSLEIGPDGNGLARTFRCVEPALSGNVDGSPREVFDCGEFVEV